MRPYREMKEEGRGREGKGRGIACNLLLMTHLPYCCTVPLTVPRTSIHHISCFPTCPPRGRTGGEEAAVLSALYPTPGGTARPLLSHLSPETFCREEEEEAVWKGCEGGEGEEVVVEKVVQEVQKLVDEAAKVHPAQPVPSVGFRPKPKPLAVYVQIW
jgi:hypothetical protein